MERAADGAEGDAGRRGRDALRDGLHQPAGGRALLPGGPVGVAAGRPDRRAAGARLHHRCAAALLQLLCSAGSTQYFARLLADSADHQSCCSLLSDLPWCSAAMYAVISAPIWVRQHSTTKCAENCVVVAEGELQHNGVFRASALGLPPVESRRTSEIAAKVRCMEF